MRIKTAVFNHYLLFLAIISAFFGSALLSFAVGPIHLFPYRLLLLVLWIVFLYQTKGIVLLSSIRVKNSLSFMIFWFLYAFLTITWSIEKDVAIKHVIFLFINISLIFFIVYYLTNINDLIKVYYIWLMVFVLLIPLGVWEIITGNHLSVSGLNEVDKGKEFYKFAPTTVFRNQNDYATLLTLSFPMLLVGIRYFKKWLNKALLIIILGFGLVMLLFTTSRSNYIALGLMVTFWLMFCMGKKQKMIFLSIVIFLGLILVSVFTEEMTESVTNMVSDMDALLTLGSDEDTGMEVRQNLIKNCVFFSLDTFGFGVGAGNVEYWMENSRKYFVGETRNVHNWFFENLANYGFVIFVGYLLTYMSIVLKLWSFWRKSDLSLKERIICEWILVGMVGFSIASVSSSSLIAFRPQWMFFGLALAFINSIKLRSI
ncbi:MAG: O-antigen ligase family protein [Cyclobacteriaceae bacterium]